MDLHSVLKKMVESVVQEQMLDEKAISNQEALNQGLALYVKRMDNRYVLTLYDSQTALNVTIPNRFDKCIIGYIEISYKVICESWIVKYSAARKGYGPLMYELAMSIVSPDFIRADTAYVSQDAQKVWSYFFTNRANEFNILPLDTKDTQCLPFSEKSPRHKEAIYQKYSMKSPYPVDALEEKHENNLAQLDDFHAKSKFNTYLVGATDRFFNEKFG